MHEIKRDGTAVLTDDEGVDLRNTAEANAYAVEVAREMIKGDEVNRRPWLLEVLDEKDTVIASVPFATADPTLDHLSPDLRDLVKQTSDSLRTIKETLHGLNAVVVGTEAVLAEQVKPHLVAVEGHRL